MSDLPKYLSLLQLFWLLPFLYSCDHTERPEFIEWQRDRNYSGKTVEKPTVHKASFYSSPLAIDTIYRSMQGPYEVKQIQIDTEEDLIWLVGYEGSIKMAGGSSESLPDKYMCHNNLNFAEKDEIPWEIKTKGKNSRIFTLSGGQTKMAFPEGFGIPVPADQRFELVSQVLNHHEKNIDISTRHLINLNYIKDSELSEPLVPLYQQAVFVTKQTSGPAGEYGLPELCVEHYLDSNKIKGKKPKHDCSVEFEPGSFNPYMDSQGRKYTAHWILPYGREILSTDVTQMMALEEESRIHAIGVHLHPFAEGLELWDKSTDSLLFATKIKTNSSGFGNKSISYYSSPEGIKVFPKHRYELKSIYNCTDSTERHTAMAAMYLYLSDK